MARTKSIDQEELKGMESDKNEAIERAGKKLRNLELDQKKLNPDIKTQKSKLRELMHEANIQPIDVNGEDVYVYRRGNIIVTVAVKETVKVQLDDEVRGRKAMSAPAEGAAE